MKTLALVVPCYNEEASLPACVAELGRVLIDMVGNGLVSPESAIYFIDDGSTDGTWAAITHYAEASHHIHGIKLAANQGHQKALLAGMLTIDCDMMITIDADLQDDIAVIEPMVRHHLQGAEIVYGIRSSRTSDRFFKRVSAEYCYRFMRLIGMRIIPNHADFRLMGRQSLDALAQYGEVNLFLRGILPQLGFSVAYLEYARKERQTGVTKYPLSRMLGLAWDGISSFSTLPLRAIFLIGMAVALLAFLFGMYALGIVLFTERAVPGWASTVIPLGFLGGVQLICTGIIGEYIGKIYLETKARPRFIIEKQV